MKLELFVRKVRRHSKWESGDNMAATTVKAQVAVWPDKKEDYELLDVIGELSFRSRTNYYVVQQCQ